MKFTLFRWLKISLFNLLIVATLGVILRYKILYYLPFVDQKHLLHGHSHFAFAGWISQALMVLLVAWLGGASGCDLFKKYRTVPKNEFAILRHSCDSLDRIQRRHQQGDSK